MALFLTVLIPSCGRVVRALYFISLHAGSVPDRPPVVLPGEARNNLADIEPTSSNPMLCHHFRRRMFPDGTGVHRSVNKLEAEFDPVSFPRSFRALVPGFRRPRAGAVATYPFAQSLLQKLVYAFLDRF